MKVIDHGEYLRMMLNDKKLRLQALNIRHQVDVAKYETKKEMFVEQIESIENQLEEDTK